MFDEQLTKDYEKAVKELKPDNRGVVIAQWRESDGMARVVYFPPPLSTKMYELFKEIAKECEFEDV